jgi:N6-L-threonylcarbamoyladenine synthase
MAALESTGLSTLVVAGGVGANRQLRERLRHEARARGSALYFPPAELCTDNGAMVAMAGLARLRSGDATVALAFEVKPRWALA